jgi:hypothetical protein
MSVLVMCCGLGDEHTRLAAFCLYLLGRLPWYFYSSAALLGGVAGRLEAPLLHCCFGANVACCIMAALDAQCIEYITSRSR